MKKLLLVFALVMGVAVAAVAQPRAIGGRIGYGVDFSYEHGLGQNMLDIDAGVAGFFNDGYGGLHAACTYDWIFPFNSWSGKGEWNWYAGVGGGLGFWFDNHEDHNYNHFNIGVAGRIGVEYNFWFPLQLSLDWRPIVGPRFCLSDDGHKHKTRIDGDDFWLGGIALGVRYKF